MQPVVQMTVRMPGPSTTAPVWIEWRKPRSDCVASFTSCDRCGVPRSVVNAHGGRMGLVASVIMALENSGWRAAQLAAASGGRRRPPPPLSPHSLNRLVEGPVDHIELLFFRQLDEVDGIARHADGKLRVLLWMLHRVEKRVSVEHVHVHVEAVLEEVAVEHIDQVAGLLVERC